LTTAPPLPVVILPFVRVRLLDRQDRPAAVGDVEDAGGVVAANGDDARAQAVDGQRLVDHQRARGQGDGPPEPALEIDGVARGGGEDGGA
jgi:hypothetical protein